MERCVTREANGHSGLPADRFRVLNSLVVFLFFSMNRTYEPQLFLLTFDVYDSCPNIDTCDAVPTHTFSDMVVYTWHLHYVCR